MTRSFRDLLTIRFAAITTAGVAFVVLAAFFVLRRTLDSELDASILNVAAIQAAALTDPGTGEMHFHDWNLTPDEAASIRDLVRYAQVWSADGESLIRSEYMTADLPLDPEALRRAASGQLLWEESTFEEVPIRSVYYPLERLGALHTQHVLQVAAPLSERNAMLGRTASFGLLLVLLAAGGSVLGGRWLADRAIRPVADIIQEAEAVGGGTLRRRIQAHARTKEYERLVDVLNRMLDRIQSAFEAQRRFTADASHELRSPLTAMRGELELALRRDRGPAEYRETIESAREEVERLSRIVEGLLILARADAGAIQPRLRRGALRATVREALDRARSAPSAPGVAVELIGGDPVPGIFDPDLVSQLVRNLVENAVRYAGPEGRVLVRVLEKGTNAVLCVEDSGPGIPGGEESAVFQRFWRADASRTPTEGYEGTGLGLAIVQAIAEAHGGSVRASNDSRLGGARFEVRLPMASRVPPTSGAARFAVEPPSEELAPS